MTHFRIDQSTDRHDCLFVEVDRRFDVAIIRTAEGLELRIYPRTAGELWSEPFTRFFADEADVIACEKELRA